jgi:hypothetical protein
MVGRRGLHTLCGLASFREARCCWRVSLGLDVRSDMRRQLTITGDSATLRLSFAFSGVNEGYSDLSQTMPDIHSSLRKFLDVRSDYHVRTV